MEKVRVEQVTKTYGKDTVLDGVSVNFEAGKIHGIIGRNGSGKTMLFKTICGFVRPTSGRVLVDGKQVGKDVDFPQDLGLIIETPGFLPYYSGYKNLKIMATLRNRIKDEGSDGAGGVGPEAEEEREEVLAGDEPAVGDCAGDYGGAEPAGAG